MCYCKDVGFGSYDVAIPVWYDARKRVVSIDYCIIPEIIKLWGEGIITIESCCGHNKQVGYVAVDESCVEIMISMGYEQFKYCCFYTKTKF